MLRNYLTIAFRNLLKHRLYSFINIGGLAVGLAACLLILLFVTDELSYEQWLPNADRIAVAETTFNVPGRDPMKFAGSPGLLKDALIKDFSTDIEGVARIYQSSEPVRIGDRQFQTDVNYVDPGFFQVLDLAVVEGDRAAALANTHSLLLSRRLARAYFGDERVIGKTLTVSGNTEFTVVGILADLPSNTHLSLEVIALLDPVGFSTRPWVLERWTSSNVYTYVLFRSPAARQRVISAMNPFIDRNVVLGVPGFEEEKTSSLVNFQLMPVRDIHLRSTAPGYSKPRGDLATVLAFSAIAGLILLIACINFINLATARAMQRAREVAMRKVLGATRAQLIRQHLGEAVLTAVIALVLAFALVELGLPWFNGFIHKSLTLRLSDPDLLLTCVGLMVGVGAIGGLYPALYLSRFVPARVLKANQPTVSGSASMRSILVVFQFSISIALIICTAIVYGQTRYARDVDLGFAHQGRLSVSELDRLATNEEVATFKSQVLAIPGVRVAALSTDSPPLRNNNNTLLYPTADVGKDQLIVESLHVDVDFFTAYQITPLAGRVFAADRPGDLPVNRAPGIEPSQSIVINQELVRKLGFLSSQDAIGKVVGEAEEIDRVATIRTTIIGVVPDLYLRSLRDPITPMLYQVRATNRGFDDLTVVVEPGRMRETVRAIEGIWERLAAGVPIHTSFVDDDLRAQYDADEQRGQIFAAFAGFAVLIACLGLFGLAAFSAERRTKEIGMRKVLGASVADIVRLLVWQFSRPVLIANLIAWPITFVLMRRWLAGFRHGIDLTDPALFLGIFGGAGLVALLIAWVTTAGHAYRVARARPGEALRCE
jgi:putative ABC transport system permease protein